MNGIESLKKRVERLTPEHGTENRAPGWEQKSPEEQRIHARQVLIIWMVIEDRLRSEPELESELDRIFKESEPKIPDAAFKAIGDWIAFQMPDPDYKKKLNDLVRAACEKSGVKWK